MSRILSNALRNREQNRRQKEVEPEIIKLQRYFREVSGELIQRREARELTRKEMSFRFAEKTGLAINSSAFRSQAYQILSSLENGDAFQDCYNSFEKKPGTKKVETLSRDLTAYLTVLGTPEEESREFVRKVSEKIKGLEYLAKK